jgi:Pentapeptide repeats (8 copies)
LQESITVHGEFYQQPPGAVGNAKFPLACSNRHVAIRFAFPRNVEDLSQDSSHIEILRRGPRPWNAWRAQNPEIVPNLSGLALSVGERQMGPINGGPINLSSSRLRHASLRFATLTGADLTMADLWDADLSDARLDRANLSGADLTEALLERADFAGARLTGANLASAKLLEVRNLTQAQIDEALGDAFTILPPDLTRPAAWTGAVSPVANEERARFQPDAMLGSVDTAPKRVETVSWLVGGPRSARVRPSTPPASRNEGGL